MQQERTYYGETFLEGKDLEETKINHKIQLEYYAIKNQKEKYGIEVIKKEYKPNGINTEIGNSNYISDNSKKVIEIINTLKANKVTPIGLNDVLEDLLKLNK